MRRFFFGLVGLINGNTGSSAVADRSAAAAEAAAARGWGAAALHPDHGYWCPPSPGGRGEKPVSGCGPETQRCAAAGAAGETTSGGSGGIAAVVPAASAFAGEVQPIADPIPLGEASRDGGAACSTSWAADSNVLESARLRSPAASSASGLRWKAPSRGPTPAGPGAACPAPGPRPPAGRWRRIRK